MQECSYGLNICFPNSLFSPYKHGMVDDLITDHKKSEVGTNALGLQFPGKKMLFSKLTIKLLFGILIFWQWFSDPMNIQRLALIAKMPSSWFTVLCMLLGIFPSLNSTALEMQSFTDSGWEIMVMLWVIVVSWLWPLESGSGPSTWPYGETLIICWNGSTTCSNSAL